MRYAEALRYLDEHVNHEARAGRIDGLSLEPMRRLLHVLGDPQYAYPAIHITGTNGKGSVGRMVSALVRETGLTVGTYSSPHLERVNERLCRDLEPIDDDSFAAVIEDVARVEPLAGVRPSYFEILTAAAFAWFADVAVDVAVIEVGLLGRFDATNVIDASVAVVTNIGQDHTDAVGDWRAAVAGEKAGIVTPDSVLVLGESDPDLRPVFEAEHPKVLWVRGDDFDVDDDRLAVGGRLVDIRTPGGTLDEVFVPLHGRHQADNAAIAVTAVEAFFGQPLEVDLVEAAFAGLTVPGRFEIVGRSPLVIIDGAHNPDGAAAAAETLVEEFDITGRRILVVGLLDGRDPGQMLEALAAGRADLVVACRPPSPRAIAPELVAAAAEALGAPAEVAPDIDDAIDRALAVATEDDLILICGSLYVAGAARASRRWRPDGPST